MVARIAESFGTPLFPWQRYVVDVALEVDPDTGWWVYDEVVITVQRRSGKTFLIKPVTAHRCGQTEPVSAWITAQRRINAVDRWRETADGLLKTPLRSGIQRKIGAGQESLSWRGSGSVFRPFAPNDTAMHGQDPDLVWVDELWAFDLAQRRAIEQGYKPAWSVKPGQAWLMSTAGTVSSAWLNQARRDGRELVELGQQRRAAYFEWSAPEELDGIPVADLPDDQLLQVVIDSHPRRDHGLRVGYLADELAGLGRPEFLRAYGNLTQTGESTTVFGADVMERAHSGARIPDGARVSFGLSVDPDRRESSIGVAWRDPSGVALTDVHRAEGTGWPTGELIRLCRDHDHGPVTVVNAGPARAVADELERAGVDLLRIPQSDHAASCDRFSDQFSSPNPLVLWNGTPPFAAAVRAAGRRRANSGRVWESRTGDPITALDAVTLAVWGADHLPVPEAPAQPFKVW